MKRIRINIKTVSDQKKSE